MRGLFLLNSQLAGHSMYDTECDSSMHLKQRDLPDGPAGKALAEESEELPCM